MRTTAIFGVILMGIGMLSLAYFVSPMRLMFHSPMLLPTMGLLPPALGALALICGIALSFGVRPRKNEKEREP